MAALLADITGQYDATVRDLRLKFNGYTHPSFRLIPSKAPADMQKINIRKNRLAHGFA